jgi:hypothetical protein
MHPEIEKLIDLALADGQITEKERNVILKKAAELGVDADEVEMTLDGKLHQLEASKPKQKEKVGKIKTCPACGATVESFTSKCSDCGHEFMNTMAVASIKNLNELLQDATNKINLAKQSIKPDEINPKNQHLYHPINIAKEINNAHAGIISSFPIPNTKEDLLEFLSISSAEAQKTPNWIGLGIHKIVQDGSDVVINAWKAKFNQVLNKSKIVFATEPSILEIINNYDLQLKRTEPNKIISKINNNLMGVLKMGCFTIILFTVLMFIITTYRSCSRMDAYQEKMMKENMK